MKKEAEIWKYMTPAELFGQKPTAKPQKTELQKAEDALHAQFTPGQREAVMAYCAALVNEHRRQQYAHG